MSYHDYYVLAATVTGAQINRADNEDELKKTLMFGGAIMGAPVAFKAAKGLVWDMPQWAYNNYGHYGESIKGSWSNFTAKNQAGRQAIKTNGFWNTVKYNEAMGKINSMHIPNQNFGQIRAMERGLQKQASELAIKTEDNLLQKAIKKAKTPANNRAIAKVKNSYVEYNSYKKVNQLIKEAEGLTGKRLAAKMRQIDRALVEAKINVNNLKASGKIVSTTNIGKACSWVKTKTGMRAAQNAVLKGTISKNGAIRGLAKGIKGGGAMIAISAACEAPNVYKTFKELGTEKGFKQLGKSAVKIGAETVGWVVGAKVGTALGTKAGTAIGTAICPGLGTAIGAAVGAVVGFIGGVATSWLCGKAAKAAVGEDELEIAKKKQAQQLAQQAQNDTQTQAKLLAKAEEKATKGEIASEKDLRSIEQSYAKLTNKLESELKSGKITYADLGLEEPEQEAQGNQVEQGETYYQNPYYENTEVDQSILALTNLARGNSYSNRDSNYAFNPYAIGFNPYTAYSNPFLGYNNPFMTFNNPFLGYNNLYAA